MKLLGALSLLSSAGVCAAADVAGPQYIFSNPPASESAFRIPTAYESAVLGRRILALTPLGTLATVFPQDSNGVKDQENRPQGLGGVPLGLMDYVADCEDSGNPTILSMRIGSSFKNVRAGSNISLAMQWSPPYPPDKRIKSTWFSRIMGVSGGDRKEPVPYSAANLPRLSLIGYLEKIDLAATPAVAACYVRTHPDSKYWLPGNPIHASEFVRLVVTGVYWIGGFGDRAYIGWLPVDAWKGITQKEWESVRLPGEKKGWNEWSTQFWEDL